MNAIYVSRAGSARNVNSAHCRRKTRRRTFSAWYGVPFPPTWLGFGVDEPQDRAYLVSLPGKLNGPITSIPSKYPLTPKNLGRLWNEVNAPWQKGAVASCGNP